MAMAGFTNLSMSLHLGWDESNDRTALCQSFSVSLFTFNIITIPWKYLLLLVVPYHTQW